MRFQRSRWVQDFHGWLKGDVSTFLHGVFNGWSRFATKNHSPGTRAWCSSQHLGLEAVDQNLHELKARFCRVINCCILKKTSFQKMYLFWHWKTMIQKGPLVWCLRTMTFSILASGTLAAHGFDPPWLFPTVNELKCKLGYGFLEDMNDKNTLVSSHWYMYI